MRTMVLMLDLGCVTHCVTIRQFLHLRINILSRQNCFCRKRYGMVLSKSAQPVISRPVIGGRQSTVVEATKTPRKLWYM